MNQQMHWATDLIGRPYRRGAHGPDEFDCWGLVRHVFATVHGIDMPVVTVGSLDDATLDNVAAIKRAAQVSGWRPSGDHTMAEHDIVLMNGLEGRHVGVMVRANGALLLLHCVEQLGVCVQPLADLARSGFTGFVFWRRGDDDGAVKAAA
jgi:hypothetical protein